MNRNDAIVYLKSELNKHNLGNWSARLTTNPNESFLGLCIHRDKCIVLNAHHIDVHPELEVINTIKHEVAHAIVGAGHAHDDVWAVKAREIGCDNTLPCSHLNLPDSVIDAIRSGQMIEMTVEEEIQVIRKPKYTIGKLQDKCPDCGKPAEEKFYFDTVDAKTGDTIRLITLKCFHIIKKVTPKGTAFDTMVSNGWKPEIRDCKHVWEKHQCTVCGEYRLMNFQVTGARLAEFGLSVQKGFGIFDDMGLGKTVQGLAIPKFHPEYTPFLVVTKSAITYQWFKQVVRWLGPDHLPLIIRTSKDTIIPGLKSYIIPYDLLRRLPSTKLEQLSNLIKLVILDECQQIKNPDSTRTQIVRNLVRNPQIKIMGLSATPWKNRGSEYFPILNMMDSIKFHSYQGFLDSWVDFYYQGEKLKQGGIKDITKFKSFTENLLVRREYNEVIDEFPDVNRMKLSLQLDNLEQKTYEDSEEDFVKWYNDKVIGGDEDNISSTEIIAQMARMRHITGLAKIPATLSFVEDFVEDTDRKLVIFVHHKDVGQLMFNALTNESSTQHQISATSGLATSLREKGIRVFKYTSELSDLERFQMQELFNKTKRAIMIASTLACGEGVDLQTCSDSVLHERQWNPQNEDQATPGRFRRIGQTSNVINITLPEAEDTVDEDLAIINDTKRVQFHRVMNKGEMPTWNQGDLAQQLVERIMKRHKNKSKGTSSITAKAKLNRKPKLMVS